jgi:hypothetical protein
VNWGTLVPPHNLIANPFTILSAGGQSITVSKTIADDFATLEQTPPTTPAGGYLFSGNFAPGDIVLDTTDSGSHLNPITLNFGATPVATGGAQIATVYGSFTAKVEAFDARGKSLASFTETGNSTKAADNSAIFIGISSTSANIYEISLSVTKAASSLGRGVVDINQFDFRTSPLAAAPAVGSSTLAPGLASAAPGTLTVTTTADSSSLTLTASNITDEIPSTSNSPLTQQVTFSYDDSSGNQVTLGTVGVSSPGTWTLTSPTAFGLTAGTYKLFAVADDSYGIFGDPFALNLSVQ